MPSLSPREGPCIRCAVVNYSIVALLLIFDVLQHTATPPVKMTRKFSAPSHLLSAEVTRHSPRANLYFSAAASFCVTPTPRARILTIAREILATTTQLKLFLQKRVFY